MTTTALSPVTRHLDALKGIVGSAFVSIEEETLHHYAHDETEDLHFLPDVVVKPGSAEEISKI